MMRWAWAKSVAAGLACAGFVAGQAPPARVSVSPPAHSSPPEAKDGPREGDVIALPTAGQPQRKVKVLRVTRPDGGEPMADLQDQATGARYTVPARMLTAKPRPIAPPARPGLLHNPTRWNKSARPSAASDAGPRYTTAPKPAAPAVTPPKLVAHRPPATKELDPVGRTPPVRTPPALVIPQVAALRTLEAASRRSGKDTLPGARVTGGATPGTRDPHREGPRSAVATPPETPLPSERPLLPPPPIARLPATESAPAPDIQPVALSDHLPPQPATPAADPMADETGPYLRDLFGALRPSVRERAATALAECRYASRPEVKAQLAKAATSDPSPDVRAHCVRLLSKLGYHESRYLDELAGWAESGAPSLKQAARDALARIAVKN